jgi:hypothetical protein
MMAEPGTELRDKPGAWVDLGLTLPIFLVYHLGVIFLRVQNATDVVTGAILRVAEGNRGMYLLITAAIGVVFAGVFAALGRGQAFRPAKFVQIVIEGVLYAVAMRIGAGYVVGRLLAAAETQPEIGRFLASASGGGAGSAHAAAVASAPAGAGPFVGLIMSFGAGFYEELAFRVLLFGLGAKLLVWVFAHQKYGVVAEQSRTLSWRAVLVMLLWSLVAAIVFSGVHYIGPLGDSFALGSFLFRMVLGLVLTAIFVTRGFAAAVWAHALYDVWVLVLPVF